MSQYEIFKKGKLTLKGEHKGFKHKKKRKNEDKNRDNLVDFDLTAHGGWAKSKLVNEITGSVCIEFGERTYVKALDNGCFTVGPPHSEGEGPSPEEILTAIILSDQKVAFKSGYGKYLGYDKEGCLTGKADAIGSLEHWEPIFQDGKLALLSSNGCFMSVRQSDDTIVVASRTAGENEYIHIRYLASIREQDPLENVPLEERGSVKDIEKNYVCKFQKFQNKKLRINSGSQVELSKAKHEGNLHETLLDRRSKMKSDRYCK
ncbi:hypothetical protein PGB90_001464 [Kerria lacca]